MRLRLRTAGVNLLALGAWLALVGAIALAALPYAVPSRWLAGMVSAKIEKALGVPVRLGGARWDWFAGLRLSGLRVGPAGTGSFVAEEVAIHATPWGLLRGRISRLELRNCNGVIRVLGKAGAGLEGCGGVAGLLGHDEGRERGGVFVENLVLERCVLRWQDQAGLGELRIASLTVTADRKTGLLQWRLAGTVAASAGRLGTITSSGRIVSPRLAERPVNLTGRAEVRWLNLDLALLPRELVSRLGLARLGGSSHGRLVLSAGSDFTLGADAEVRFEALAVRTADGRAVGIDRCSLLAGADWHLLDDRVEVRQVRIELPYALLQNDGTALLQRTDHGRVVRADFRLDVLDAGEALSALKGLGLALPAELTVGGSAKVRASLALDGPRGQGNVQFVGYDCGINWPGRFVKPAGQPCNLTVSLQKDGQRNRLSAAVRLAGGEIAADLEAVINWRNGRIAAAALERFALACRWDDLEGLSSHWPGLSAWRPLAATVRGSGNVAVKLSSSGGEGYSFECSGLLPRRSVVEAGKYFRKPAGQRLNLTAEGRFLPRAGRMSLRRAELSVDGRPVVSLVGLSIASEQSREERLPDAAEGLAVWASGGGKVEDYNALLSMVPVLRQAGKRFAEVDGAFSWWFSALVGLRFGERRAELTRFSGSLKVDLTRARVAVRGRFGKPSGEPMEVTALCRFGLGEQSRKTELTVEAGVRTDFADAQVWYASPAGSVEPQQWCWGWIRIKDAAAARRFLVPVMENLPLGELAGHGVFQWQWQRQADRFLLGVSCRLDEMRWTVPGLGLAKAAGVPARLRLYLSGPADLQGDRSGLIKLYNTEARYGGIEVSIKEGALELSEPWRTLLAGRSGPDLEDLRRNWPVKSAQLEAGGTVNLHRAADWLSPAVRRRIRTAGLAGTASWRLRFRYEQPASAVLEAFCDATDLGFNLGPVNKAKGVRGVARAVVKVAPAEDGSSRFECVLEDFRLEFASAAVRCAGRALLEPLRRPPARIDALSAEITADMRDLERLSQALLARSGLRLSGSAGLDVRVRYEERSGWSIESAEVGLWPLGWSASGTEGRLEGYISARRGRIAATGLQFSIGSTAGSATFHLARRDGKVGGVVGLAFESLDAQEMADLVRQLRASLDKARPRFGALLSAGGPGLSKTGGAISLRLFGRCDEGKFILRLPDGGSFAVPLDGLGWQAKISGNIVQADAVGAFEGGAFQASISGSTADGADLRISYTVLECLPTPVSRQIVGRSFPGLRITGPITLRETFRVPVGRRVKVFPGRGEMIIAGGEVAGRAAPQWMTRLFPGLRLARFTFRRLHNWFKRDETGKTINRMIFRSVPWSLYMSGRTMLDGTFEYEVGIDLLGPFESEYWAEADKGRIPLFTKTGRVIGGRIQNERVSYLSPQQVIARILKDNVVTLTYHIIRRQVLRGRTAARP